LIPVDDRQIRKNQLIFREVNERIAEITASQSEAVSEFLCECGRAECTSLIDLTLADYQALRDGEDHFVVAPGHCVDGVDRLVESRDGFDVLVQV
jgi:hypothetical protein